MKFRYSSLALLVLFALVLAGQLFAGSSPAMLTVKSAASPQNLHTAGLALDKAEAQFSRALSHGMEQAALQQRMEAQMTASLRPEVLVPQFVKYFRQNPEARLRTASLQKASALPMGSLAGNVLVNGNAPDPSYQILVIAFDTHGYYMSHDVVQEDGHYSVTELPVGDYYVLTLSNRYVDEIYNNLVSSLDARETWQQATLVKVQEGLVTPNINFDLQKGAVIAGFVMREDGSSPVQDQDITFVLTRKDSKVPVFEQTFYTTDGYYDLVVPLTGDYKVSAMVDGYMPRWYNQQTDWSNATALTITDYNTLITGVDFTMQIDPAQAQLGGITGSYRYKDQFIPPLLSFATVFVFDAVDTSLAMLTIGISGGYTVEGLPPGQYYVYLNDQLGNLIGTSNYLGQYYENSNTPAGAKTVTVSPGQMKEGIDFALEKGGILSGTITSETGAKLDGVWVLAIDASLVNLELAPFMANLQIFIGQADNQGKYVLNGIPTGSYIVRTISDSLVNADLTIIKITSGQHAGEVVDEYYGGKTNLLDMISATPVSVTAPNETKNINFVLEKAKYITGKITDSITGEAMSAYRLFALTDTSGLPYISFSALLGEGKQIDNSGTYRLGPLPAGNFKIFAMAPLSGPNNYLSEFYNGAYTFDTAQVLTVGSSNLTGINFTVEKAAMIQGYVDLPQPGGNIRAGAGVLEGFPVLVYESTTGQLASMDFVQFTGGYRIDHLLPGSYKVLALPSVPQLAATYFGGGNSWDAAESQTVVVGFGGVANCDILLEPAMGGISGTVVDAATGKGLDQVMVLAYDPTGHPAGLALSNFDMATGTPVDQNGAYIIPGLRAGQYYLRTFSMSSALGLSDQLLSLVDSFSGGDVDIMGLLLGGGLNSLGGLFDLDMSFYADKWHSNVAAPLTLNLQAIVANLLAYGMPSGYDNAVLPVYLPMPLAEKVPSGAVPVSVAEATVVTGIQFRLSEGSLDDMINTGIAEDKTRIPDQFDVRPNYPNPFNPSTTLSFTMDKSGEITITIFDALGRRVRDVYQGNAAAGSYQMVWNGRDNQGESVASGLYIARFNANGMQKSIKMLLMK